MSFAIAGEERNSCLLAMYFPLAFMRQPHHGSKNQHVCPQEQPQAPRRRTPVPPSPPLPWFEGGSEDFIPGLPDTWSQIISQPKLVARPLIDMASTSSKSPFTPALGRQVPWDWLN